MTSWVYLFSKFTAEALLFEAFAIAVLCASYAAFWVLRKRRLGVIQQEVPSGVVKGYLNELIFDAEQLRAQLFGLLASTGIQMTDRVARIAMPVATVGAADPEAQAKLTALEAKMMEQARAMEAIVADKARIEKDLADARAKGGAAATGGSDPELAGLQEKVRTLESRLAEYSVIEDDLANLKRLQQENVQLKATLAGSGATAPAAALAPAPAASAPAPAATAAAPAPAPAPAAAKAEASPMDLLATGSGADAAFEGLVDQVEESLKTSEPAQAAAPAAAPAAAAKSDEDLVAEFEKMLSS